MKRSSIFFILMWICFLFANAQNDTQNFIVYSVANTVKSSNKPIKQGQKLDIKAKVECTTNATLDLLSIENRKRYILNVKKGSFLLGKLINKSNGIDLSLEYFRYLMQQLLKRTSVVEGDGEDTGGINRDGQEDMFDIQDWLDQDSINNIHVPDTIL